MELKVKKLNELSRLPFKAYPDDAGYDLASCENILIEPGKVVKIHTGIAIQLPHGATGFIWDRSGMGARGLHRFAGVIDNKYIGEILVCLYNSTDTPYEVQIGDRIAQLIIQKVEHVDVIEVNELFKTDRGDAGFNSTGK